MENNIVITGKIIECKYGSFNFNMFDNNTKEKINELISTVKIFTNNSDSRISRLFIDGEGVKAFFTKNGINKNYDGSEESKKIKEFVSEILINIENIK